MTVTTQEPALIFQGIAKISKNYLVQGRKSQTRKTTLREIESCKAKNPIPKNHLAQGGNCSRAFVDLAELGEALDLYFDDSLNHVSSECVNLPLEGLVPGKPLISQLDMEDMRSALAALQSEDRAAITLAHASPDDVAVIGTGGDYSEALERLGQIVASRL